MSTEIVKQDSSHALVTDGVRLDGLGGMMQFAQVVVKSGLAPKGLERPESIVVVLQMGCELGLSPMQSLQSIGVINGRAGIYGDAALALVRGVGLLESYEQTTVGDGDDMCAVVKVRRRGDPAVYEERFSVTDAKRAGLWGKSGPWAQYPRRMLMWRARGFVLRDAFGDVLRGLRTTEELQDIPRDERRVDAATGEVLPVVPVAQPSQPASTLADELCAALDSAATLDDVKQARMRYASNKRKLSRDEAARVEEHGRAAVARLTPAPAEEPQAGPTTDEEAAQ